MDNFAGRGSNLIAGAYEGRRVVGYDLSTTNLDLIRSTCLGHTRIKPEDLTLHHSCGVELAEYKSVTDHFDLIINDVPYIFGAEDYESDDDYDNLGAFYFCKTNRKPYDALVWNILRKAYQIAPEKIHIRNDDGIHFGEEKFNVRISD